MCPRSTGSPAFFVPQRGQGVGEPVGAVARPHPWPVAGSLGQGGVPAGYQSRQHWGGFAFSGWNDPGDEPPVFGHVNGLSVPDPGQHLTGVMAEVPQANAVLLGGAHEPNVLQICGYKADLNGFTSTADEVLRCTEW